MICSVGFLVFNVNDLKVGVRCFALAATLLESLTPFALLFFVLSGAVVLTIVQICIDGQFLVLDIVHISCVV